MSAMNNLGFAGGGNVSIISCVRTGTLLFDVGNNHFHFLLKQ